jgi:hypothetical protein
MIFSLLGEIPVAAIFMEEIAEVGLQYTVICATIKDIQLDSTDKE